MTKGKPINDYGQKATRYAQHKIEGTLRLAYREFGALFSKYITEGNKALDFGCGAGRSTRYLKEMGFAADGVDISQEMIGQSKHEDAGGCYSLIESGKIPARDSCYDLALSTLVLFEIPTLQEMKESFQEIYRTMRFNGTFIALTVNDDFYNHDWVSVDTNYPQNKSPAEGSVVTVKIKESGMELNDYYWKREDYRRVAEEAGFTVVEELQPLASQDDDTESWISEREFAPYVIFVMKKTASLTPAKIKANELELIKLPGKGYFKELEVSTELVSNEQLGEEFSGARNKYSSVLLLMKENDKWPFHKLKSKESFKHIEGKDLILHLINRDGQYTQILLGKEADSAVAEFTVEPGTWVAEEVDGSGYSIISAITEPGFHPDDVEDGKRSDLLSLVGNNQVAIDVINKILPFEKEPPAEVTFHPDSRTQEPTHITQDCAGYQPF